MSACCCSLAGTVACDHCRNKSMTFEYSAGTTYSSEDFDFPKKKQTNADRIRAMSDEELADWLCHIVSNETVNCPHCIVQEYCKMGRNGFKDWLKQPSEN